MASRYCTADPAGRILVSAGRGLEPGDTDKTAGRVARLFLHGTSSYLLELQR